MRNVGDAILWDMMLCSLLKLWHHIPQGCISYCCEKGCAVYCLELPISVHLICFCWAHFTNAFWSQSWASWTQCWWFGSLTVLSQQKFTEATQFASQLLLKETCWFVVCWPACCPPPSQNGHTNIAKTVDYSHLLNTLLWHQTSKTYTKHLILLMIVTYETML
jgi:hypothetical protein